MTDYKQSPLCTQMYTHTHVIAISTKAKRYVTRRTSPWRGWCGNHYTSDSQG